MVLTLESKKLAIRITASLACSPEDKWTKLSKGRLTSIHFKCKQVYWNKMKTQACEVGRTFLLVKYLTSVYAELNTRS